MSFLAEAARSQDADDQPETEETGNAKENRADEVELAGLVLAGDRGCTDHQRPHQNAERETIRRVI